MGNKSLIILILSVEWMIFFGLLKLQLPSISWWLVLLPLIILAALSLLCFMAIILFVVLLSFLDLDEDPDYYW